MVQFITHFTDRYTYLDSVRLALEGGCRWVQLRMKGSTDEQLLAVAREALALCRERGAKLIIDDNVSVAQRVGADGVHLGREDMPIAEARRLLGPDFIIGGTANTFEDVVAHHLSGADYIGCGPYRFTTTKQRLSPTLGTEGLLSIVERMREERITLPIVAIGGIGAADIDPIMRTGVTGIALSGSVLRADDPIAEMNNIIKTVERWKN